MPRGPSVGLGLKRKTSRVLSSPAAPTNIFLSATSFDEDRPLGPIATITANGSPASGFTIANDPAGLFSIIGNVLHLVAPFDYEASTSHTLEIEASNGVGDPYVKEFTITVNDVFEGAAPTDIVLSETSVDENAGLGSIVGTFDVDGIPVADLSIVADPDNKFALDGDNLILDGPLDFEDKENHTVRIRAYNGVGSPIEEEFTITVNDIAEGGTTIVDQTAFFPASAAAGTTRFKPFDSNGDEVDITSIVDPGTGSLNPSISADNGLVFDGLPSADNGREIIVGTPLGNARLTLDSTRTGEGYASVSELTSLLATSIDGRTFFGRPGRYEFGGNGFWNGKFNDLTEGIGAIFDACRSDEEKSLPSFDYLAFFSFSTPSTSIGDAIFRNTKFYRAVGTEDKLTGNLGDTIGLVLIEKTQMPPRNILFEESCVFESDAPIARLTGTRPADSVRGVWARAGTNIVVQDCIARNLMSMGEFDNTDGLFLRRNVQTHCWDDMFKITGNQSGGELFDNMMHSCIGDHGFHPDMYHFFQGAGNSNTIIRNFKIRGTIIFGNVEGHLAPAWPTSDINNALNREASYHSGNRTLTEADVDLFIMVDDGASASFELGDPSAASAVGELAIQARCLGGLAPSGIITINSGGYTLIDGDNGNAVIAATMLVQPWETVLLRIDPGNNRWSIQRVPPIYQGVFTNTSVDGHHYLDIDIDDPLLWLVGARNGIRFDGASTARIRVRRAACLQAWIGDLNGSGYPNTKPQGGPIIQGEFSTQGSDCLAEDSLLFRTNGDITASRITLPAQCDPTVWADVVANFNVADPGNQVHMPTSRLEAIEMARPRAGSNFANTSTGFGLKPDKANDTYNFGQFPDEPLGPRGDPATVSAVAGVQTGQTTADWGAVSDEAGGTMFAAVRLASDGQLTRLNIENGTGDAIATDSDTTPTADANNGGSFTGLTAATTYVVDVFHRDADGEESPVVSSGSFTTAAASVDITPVVLGAYADNGVKESPKTLTTTVAASGNHPVLVLVPNRANSGTNQTVTAALASTPMSQINSAFIAQLNLHSFWIPSTSVPAGLFDIVISNAALFNGMDIVALEVVNARDDQTGAAIGTAIQAANSQDESPSVTTTAAGSLVVAHTCTFHAHDGITGADATVDDGTTQIGNGVTFSGVAYKKQATAGSTSISFSTINAGLFAAHAFEVLKA